MTAFKLYFYFLQLIIIGLYCTLEFALSVFLVFLPLKGRKEWERGRASEGMQREGD